MFPTDKYLPFYFPASTAKILCVPNPKEKKYYCV